MTIRLFDRDPKMNQFTAKVLSCVRNKERFETELDCTAFYPEGGGQPADHGTIDGIEVFDVHERDGIIWHYTREPLEEGSTVNGVIDRKRRADYTQQHSGEHILSGIIHNRYGYENVGFHMGSAVTEIDFNGRIPDEDIEGLEEAANRYIQENHEVVIHVFPDEESVPYDYRSKKELDGDVRIVEFPGADRCACCGTHVLYSGEIGLLKIIGSENFHEGTRLHIISGNRALEYLNSIYKNNREISALLSAKPMETAPAVRRLFDEKELLKRKITKYSTRYFSILSDSFKGEDDAVLFLEEADSAEIRELCTLIMDKTTGLVCIFSGDDDSGYRYAVGQKDGNVRDFVNKMNSALLGRGGGKDNFFSQGSLSTDRRSIENFMSK